MKILSRAILRLFFRLLGLCLGSFSLIFLVVEILDKMRRFSRTQSGITTISFYFLNKLPEMISMALPFSMLLATILTMGILSRNNELTAMRSCGISLHFIGRPLLVAALLISILTFCTNEVILPVTFQNIREIEETVLKRNEYGAVFRQNNIWYREAPLILQARLFDPVTLSLKGITIWVNNGMNPLKRYDAEEGRLTSAGWEFRGVVARDLPEDARIVATAVPTMLMPIRLTLEDLKKVADYTSNMGFFDLRSYTRKLKRGGYDVTRYLADMHARIALPFAGCIMVLLGMPFAVRSGRSVSTALGIAQGLAIGFIYYVVNALLISLGHNGVLPPLVAAWSANVIFAMIGVWLMLTLEQ